MYRLVVEDGVREGKASKTAENNALFRAFEASRPQVERPVRDLWAAGFLSPPMRAVERVGRNRLGHALVTAFIDLAWPGVRTSVVARTRLIDDLVDELTERVRQVVLLGAGYDSRAHRLTCLQRAVVFEVDHPATQARKRALLEHVGTNGNVRYVATDFHDGSLDDVLGAAGYDRRAATLFVWEGVTNYLTEAAVDTTLRWCASAPAESHLLFTYIDRRVLADPAAFHRATRVLATARRAGESLTFGIAPNETRDYLRACGLELKLDIGAADYRNSYYGARARRIRGHEFYRVAVARVRG